MTELVLLVLCPSWWTPSTPPGLTHPFLDLEDLEDPMNYQLIAKLLLRRRSKILDKQAVRTAKPERPNKLLSSYNSSLDYVDALSSLEVNRAKQE